MASPATTGQLRTRIVDMQIGDYIIVSYDNTNRWVVGANGKAEAPLTGTNASTTLMNAYIYFVKVDKGLLVADRVTHHTITWDALNGTNRFIQNFAWTLDGIAGAMRSFSGGVSFMDAYGGRAASDTTYGAYPPSNEWDTYIVNFPTSLIQAGKTLDDVFHWGVATFCQETPALGLQNTTGTAATNGYRVWRGGSLKASQFNHSLSNTTFASIGFRPVFEYKEV